MELDIKIRPFALALATSGLLLALLTACIAQTGTSPDVAGRSAVLAVQLDEQRTLVRGVSWLASEPISGLAALQSTDLEVVTADLSWGTAVCSIAGVGCPADDCFCGDDTFWNYMTWDGTSWQSYPVGPAQNIITQSGTLEGWRWGAGDVTLVAPARIEAAQAALFYLVNEQSNPESARASMSADVETLLAVGANRVDITQWALDSPSLLDFVVDNAASYSQEGVSSAGKLAVGMVGVENGCWPADAMRPSDYYSPTIGALAADTGPLAWGILGTLALDEPVPTGSVDYLLNLALPEGGWEWAQGWGRDTNSTSLALQALVAADIPISHTAIISAVAYLRSAQSDAGGFSYDPFGQWGNVPDTNSTAYVVQALTALGEDVTGEAWQAANGDPIDFILSLQSGGGIGWQTEQPAPNLGATQQAIPALLGQPYPLRQVALPACGQE